MKTARGLVVASLLLGLALGCGRDGPPTKTSPLPPAADHQKGPLRQKTRP